MSTPRRRRAASASELAVLGGFAVAHLAIATATVFGAPPVIANLHNDTLHRLGRAADFFAVYHAGVNARIGRSPYDERPDGTTPYFFPFRYLPVLAVGAQALTLASPWLAYLGWVLVCEALLFLLIHALSRAIRDGPEWVLVSALLLVSSPYFLELYMGQFTFASVALTGLAFLLPGGALLYTAAVLLKLYPLAALPALLRQRRTWGHAVAAVAALTILSGVYFARHPDQWSYFFLANVRAVGGLDSGNYGFVRLLHLLAEDAHFGWLLAHWDAVIPSLRLGLLAACAWIVLVSRNRHVLTGVCLLLLAHFVSFQHVWEHNMSGVAVIAALLLTRPDAGRGYRVAVLLSLLLLVLPTPFGLFDTQRDGKVWDPAVSWPRYASYLILLPKVVPTVALFGLSLGAVLRAGGGSAGGGGNEATGPDPRT